MNEPVTQSNLRRDRPSSRYNLLDVCRGIACLMVVLHHAGFAIVQEGSLASGVEGQVQRAVISAFWEMNLGVPLFFVISGYCIGASADTARRKGWGAFSFLRRRFWRIYPPYWAAVLLFVVVTAGLDALGLTRLHYGVGAYALQLDSPGKLNLVQWIGNLSLTEEWRPLVWRPPDRSVYTRVAWSLCYEEQFYFLCFLSLLLARKRLYGVWAAATVMIVAYRAICLDIGRGPTIQGSFFLLWHEFAIGLAVYWALNAAPTMEARRAVAGALAVLAVAGFVSGPGATVVAYSTPTSALFGLLLIVLRPWDDRATELPWLAPLRACGLRSYSIYLVHLPVCTVGNLVLVECGLTGFWTRVLVMIPVVSCAAVGVSWVFYHAVERHFLNAPAGLRGRAPALPLPETVG